MNITDNTEHRLESPNYPLDYLPTKECIWKITVPPEFQVSPVCSRSPICRIYLISSGVGGT